MYEDIENIFKRMKFKNYIDFFLNGVDSEYVNPCSFGCKLEQDSEDIVNALKKLCPDENDFEREYNKLEKALLSYQEVFTEVGFIAGARFIIQIIGANPNDSVLSALSKFDKDK